MITTKTTEAATPSTQRGQWQSGKDKPVIEQRHKDAAAWAMDRGGDNLTWDNATASHVSPERLWQMNRVAEAMARMERDVLAELTPPTQGGEWRWVPVEPKPSLAAKMRDAWEKTDGHLHSYDGFLARYRAMLSAIPDASPGSATPSAPTAERLRSALEQALKCTPSIRDGEIVYDCGDPWEILRAALSDAGEGSGVADAASDGLREPHVFLDCDGVLADFDTYAEAYFGMPPRAYEAKVGSGRFWKELEAKGDFYRNLPLMADARELFEGVKHLHPTILTGCPRGDWAQGQKVAWAAEHFPGVPIITCRSADKRDYAKPGDVLIDDWAQHRHRWIEMGGVFITHHDAASSLAALWAHYPSLRTALDQPQSGEGLGDA